MTVALGIGWRIVVDQQVADSRIGHKPRRHGRRRQVGLVGIFHGRSRAVDGWNPAAMLEVQAVDINQPGFSQVADGQAAVEPVTPVAQIGLNRLAHLLQKVGRIGRRQVFAVITHVAASSCMEWAMATNWMLSVVDTST
jgi:hypothetical protein